MSGDRLTHEKADPNHDRIDLVYETTDREIRILTGTPTARPTPPPLPDGALWALARVRIIAGSGIVSIDTSPPTPRRFPDLVVPRIDHERLQRDIARLAEE